MERPWTENPETLGSIPAAGTRFGDTMQAYQERVLNEKAELDLRLEKLRAFYLDPLFASLPTDEQERLSRQAEVMQQYSEILGQRIAHF